MLREAMEGLPGMGGAVLLNPQRRPQAGPQPERAQRLPEGKVFLIHVWDRDRDIGWFMHEGNIMMNQLGWGIVEGAKLRMPHGILDEKLIGEPVRELTFVGANISGTMQLVNAPEWWNDRPRA